MWQFDQDCQDSLLGQGAQVELDTDGAVIYIRLILKLKLHKNKSQENYQFHLGGSLHKLPGGQLT